VGITLLSCQLLKTGKWLSETCWATCKVEIKDNTKVTSGWFLIPTEWQCMVSHTSGNVRCCLLYRYCLMYERLTFWLFQFDILMLEFCKLCILFHHHTVHCDIIKFILFTNWCTRKCLENNFEIYININIKTALTCFGSVTPSSRSALLVLAKVTVNRWI